MQLNFNLEDINYLKMELKIGDKEESLRLALKEKRENEFIAIATSVDSTNIRIPQKVTLGFVCNDGLYTTNADLKDVITEDDYTYFIIQNPATLDYQQNREYYRVLTEHDCIYTVHSEYDTESYSAVTYDLSAGGVSIVLPENVISKEECSILIMLPDGDLKSHVKFIRCSIYEDVYKLSFEFTDLSERDYDRLQNLCVSKQMSEIENL